MSGVQRLFKTQHMYQSAQSMISIKLQQKLVKNVIVGSRSWQVNPMNTSLDMGAVERQKRTVMQQCLGSFWDEFYLNPNQYKSLPNKNEAWNVILSRDLKCSPAVWNDAFFSLSRRWLLSFFFTQQSSFLADQLPTAANCSSCLEEKQNKKLSFGHQNDLFS